MSKGRETCKLGERDMREGERETGFRRDRV